jgi:hypothetical protein
VICPACGAEVQVVTDVTTGRRVALEPYTDASSEAQRYRIVSMTDGDIRAEPVPSDAPGDFYPVHTFDCPDSSWLEAT